MRKFLILMITFSLFNCICSKQTDEFELKESTPAYQFAEDLAALLPSLDPNENRVLVETNDFNITIGETIHELFLNMGETISQLKNESAEQLKYIIRRQAQQLADKKLLLNASKEANITVSQHEIDEAMNRQYMEAGSKEKFLELIKKRGLDIEFVENDIREELIIKRFSDEIIFSKVQVIEQEIEQLYQEDKTATVRHIFFSTQGKSNYEKEEICKRMAEILTLARKGEDFAMLAKKYSEDPGSKEKGGLIENIGRGQVVKSFEEVAFSVPVGEISNVFETPFGYHVIKVIEREKESQSLEEIRTQLEETIKQKKQMKAYQTYLTKLKKESRFKMREL